MLNVPLFAASTPSNVCNNAIAFLFLHLFFFLFFFFFVFSHMELRLFRLARLVHPFVCIPLFFSFVSVCYCLVGHYN